MSNTSNLLSTEQKQTLKAQAHGLKPVVMIGDKGLTESVIEEANTALAAHGLIKIRIHGDDRESRIEIAHQICQSTNAHIVQHIGKLCVLYRPLAENTDQKSTKKATKKKPRVTKRQMNT